MKTCPFIFINTMKNYIFSKNQILFSILFIFINVIEANCQGEELDTNPPSLKWSKIKSAHFKVIYPNGLDSIANRTINVLETNYLPVASSLGKPPRPIAIILQNQNTVSNGFVSYTPRRSEFFITPPQDYTLLGTYNWFDQLAKHEYRHIVQFDKALTGPNKYLHYLIGNLGISGLSFVVVPPWFWEGDAVGTETAHSLSGRGSIPAFSALMRSQLVDFKKPFSFSKANGRSFKHNVPNHYVLGYHLTNYMKEQHGYDVWGKILTKTYNFPIYPFSFSNNVKKITGKSIDKVYNDAYLNLKNQLQVQIENRVLYESNYINHSKPKYYTDYEYPQVINGNSVLAIKSGLANIAQLVILDDKNKEKKVHELGQHNDGSTLSVANNKAVWAEFMPDPRWKMRDYSNLKLIDLNTKKVIQLTKKARLAAPALSPNGRQIVAVNTAENGKYSLQFINAESGSIWKELPNPNNVFYQHPSWSADGKSIVVVGLLNNEKTIQLIDLESGEVKNLLPFSNNNYAHPILKGNFLLYNNALKGIDNVFLLNIKDNKNYQVTDAKFGAYNAVFTDNNDFVLFSDFTSTGHRIAKIPFEFGSLREVQNTDVEPVKYFGKWMLNEADSKFKKEIEMPKYQPSKHSKWNVLNVNSWGLVANSGGSGLSVGVNTQDLLSTTTTALNYSYSPFERQSSYSAGISYQGFFPIIDLNFENAGRQTVIPKEQNPETKVKLVDNWRQQAISLGIRLPLTFQRNKFVNRVSLGSSLSFIEGQGYQLKGRFTSQIGDNTLQSVTNYLSFSRRMKAAKRDVASRFEQSALIYSRNTPFGGDLKAKLFAGQASLTFPGVGRHDIIRFKASYLTNGAKNTYNFSSPIAFPRGYDYSIFDKLTFASVDYKVPIADPDFALGRLFYFQRIKGGLFVDFGQGQVVDDKNVTRKYAYNSYGFDLSTIFNFMRLNVPIEMGVRFNYTPNDPDKLFKITPLVLDIPF
jgi:hypothetical protein